MSSTMDPGPAPQFSVPDYLVLCAVLLISSFIGLYYRFSGGQQKTTQEYLLADGKMSVLPVAFSLMASFMSAITLLGVTQENYTFGTQFVMINFAYLISTPVAAYVFLPVFYKLHSASVYKYLEERFGYFTRLLASLAFTTQMILYMGIVLYAPSLALSAVTGVNFKGAVFAIGLVCTFYSTLGGIKAVLMTDVFQSLLMFSAIFSVIAFSLLDAGGVEPILTTAQEHGRIQFFELSPDPTVRHTVWTQVFGGCFVYLSLYAVNQAQVQRLRTLPSLKKAQAALWIQVPILMLLSFSTSFAGLCIFYHYKDCDPFQSGLIRSPDQLLPQYIVDRMSSMPGVPGLAVAGIFCGTLSTVSSAINSLAAVTLEDYIKPCIAVPESRTTMVTKVLALFYGLACIGLAFLADILGTGVLQASLTIFGVVGGPLLALFTLGVLCRRVEQKGAVVGFLVGLAFISWIGFGGPKPGPTKLPVSVANCTNISNNTSYPLIPTDRLTVVDDVEPVQESHSVPEAKEYFYLYRISYAWFCFLGFLATLIMGNITSELVRLAEGRSPRQPGAGAVLSRLSRREGKEGQWDMDIFKKGQKKEEEPIVK